MLINKKYKFIFIHNYKVAGNSVRLALQEYDDLKHPLRKWMYKRAIRQTHGHEKAHYILSALGDQEFKTYFKFGFVRNPWDWQVSLYKYMLAKKDHFQHDFIKSLDGFEQYIVWRIKNDFHCQKSFFYSSDGNKLVDYIGKFECLNKDFRKICESIGLPEMDLPHTNAISSPDYRSYYTDFTRDLVQEAFTEDIETFHYQF